MRQFNITKYLLKLKYTMATNLDPADDWQEAIDRESGDTYYYNLSTSQTSWTNPSHTTNTTSELSQIMYQRLIKKDSKLQNLISQEEVQNIIQQHNITQLNRKDIEMIIQEIQAHIKTKQHSQPKKSPSFVTENLTIPRIDENHHAPKETISQKYTIIIDFALLN